MTRNTLHKVPETFFRFLNELKLYHWRTKRYARHKATDELYQAFQEFHDRFIETLMGSTGQKVMIRNTLPVRVFTDNKAPLLLQEMYEYLMNLNRYKWMKGDLQNLRDEICSSLQQTLYLFQLF